MINIKNVSFGYFEPGDTLRNVNLHVAPGECVLLCGKSGCGKTTVTKLVNGLIPHFTEKCYLEGSITAADMDVPNTEMYKLAKRIGSVFQNPKSQFFNIDSNSEIAFGLENQGIPSEVIKNRVKYISNALKIDKLLHRNIFTMSGGEKQSLAFASVHAMNPDIYVLDEPTANLDVGAIDILKEQITEIKRQGKTILIAEHRLYYLADLIDRAVYMENGEIVSTFSRDEFLALSNKERVKMGLRTLYKESVHSFLPINSQCQLEKRLVVKNLSFSIKNNKIFDKIEFSASNGEIIGVWGKNGAGKTTLMRCIAGLVKEKSGEVILDGKVLKSKARNNTCYMIMQDVNHQLFGESAWNECEISVSDISKESIIKVLKTFDLYQFRHNHPMGLSGGQKQRLAIATGVLANKRVLIFDEPTSGLDYDHMIAVSQTIKKLAKNGHIILIITHDIEFLNLTCTKVVKLNGEIRNA